MLKALESNPDGWSWSPRCVFQQRPSLQAPLGSSRWQGRLACARQIEERCSAGLAEAAAFRCLLLLKQSPKISVGSGAGHGGYICNKPWPQPLRHCQALPSD